MPSLRHTKKFIAAYVACGGRMHLYAHLDKSECEFCIVTYSVVFVQKEGESPLVQCCDVMGDITPELKGNEYISEFVSGGPKNNAYKLCNSVTGWVKIVYKVRGITLNYKAAQNHEFGALKTWS